MQHSLKVENTPTQHRRNRKLLGITQASFLVTFKATSNKVDQKKHPPQFSKDIMCPAIYYKIQVTN